MDAAAQSAGLTPQRDGRWLAANARARESLAAFVRMVWPEINPGVPLVWSWYLAAICEHLEAVTRGDITQLVINVPPGSGKTTCVSVCWPVWEWLREPENRWLFAAHGTDLPIRDNTWRRRIITSDWFIREMAPSWALAGDMNLKSQFENDRGGLMKATSVGAGIIGRHADRQVIDDPIKPQDIHGAALIEHVRWYFEAFQSRVRDHARRVLIMQRLSQCDLAGALLETGQWEHLCLPAEYRSKYHCSTSLGWHDPRTKDGELLDPVRFSKSRLEEIRLGGDAVTPGMGTALYMAQYQQDPVADGGNIVQRDWWRYYALDDADATDNVPLLPERFDAAVGSWDMTFKKSDTSDFVVGQVWGRVGSRFYLLDQIRRRMSFVETEAAVVRLVDKWPECRRWLVEEAANGAGIVDRLKSRVPGILAVTVRDSKEARLSAVSSLIEAGQVCLPLPKDARWVIDYIEETAAFPKGANDDQVDATTLALRDMVRRARIADLPEVRRLRRTPQETTVEGVLGLKRKAAPSAGHTMAAARRRSRLERMAQKHGFELPDG